MHDFETRFISNAPSIFITVEFGLNLHSNALCTLNIANVAQICCPVYIDRSYLQEIQTNRSRNVFYHCSKILRISARFLYSVATTPRIFEYESTYAEWSIPSNLGGLFYLNISMIIWVFPRKYLLHQLYFTLRSLILLKVTEYKIFVVLFKIPI